MIAHNPPAKTSSFLASFWPAASAANLRVPLPHVEQIRNDFKKRGATLAG
jgi:hypothetical protein